MPILLDANDPTTAYAKAVSAGRIVAGEFVRAACRRHLTDLGGGRDRGLVWKPEKAASAIGFYPAVLSVTAGAREGNPFELLDWHKFVIGNLFGWHRTSGLRRFKTAWLETGKGQAKALALDTPIPTPFGWTTMGELRDGDEIYGPDGSPCRVLKAHPVVYGQDCYRVEFDDGASVVANAGHLWRTEKRRHSADDRGAATRGIPLSQRGAWREGVRTTEEIAATLRYANGKYQSANHSVVLASPLAGVRADLPIPPYALGFWLGDGDSDQARITVCNDDSLQSIALLSACGVRVGDKQKNSYERAGRHGLSLDAKIRDGFGARLKRLGLIGNKHIPELYLRASVEQRWDLLRGLMDTDGSVTDSQCAFTNTNNALARGVHELALSLGLKATIFEGSAKLNGRLIGAYYRVSFYAPSGAKVFGLERKQARVAHKHARRRLSGDRKIISCDKIDSVPVRCITVDREDGMFLCGRELIPTHNSPVMAATGLLVLGFCGIPRAEIYAIASNRNQANVLFKDAVAMCRAQIPGRDEGETLESIQENGVIIRGTADNAWKIEHPDSGSKFQALAGGEAVSGPRPCLVLADEIHEFKSDEDLRTWRAALAKMPGDSLMMLGTNTPATDQLVGTDYSERFQKVVLGEVQDDSAFVYIARVDKDDEPFEDESCWVKALPALGVTFPADNVRTEVTTSLYHPPTYAATARLYFGIPGSSSSFWVSEEAWMAIQGRVDEKALVGLPCWLSLDLSEKNDLTALTAVWRRDDGVLLAKTWYWTPGDTIKERSRDDNVPYEQWAVEKFISAPPGPTIDKRFVARQVAAICDEHDVQFIADDPSGIDDFIAACDEIGFEVWKFKGPDAERGSGLPLVTHGQGPRIMFAEKSLCMPRSIEKFEDAILNRTIVIDDNKVTLMCAANAMVDADRFNNRFFDKKRSRGRIDGMVTIAMAVGAASSEVAVEEWSISVFDRIAMRASARPAQSNDDDETILANPAHPQWQEARERWERKHLSSDDIW